MFLFRSALFVKQQLRVFPLRLVGADQEEVHVGQDAEAAVPAQLRLQLAAQIGGAVVQELCRGPIGQTVREIDPPAR